MNVHIVPSEEAAAAEGAVVVIDVLRAFTTSAYAFAAGASSITLVETVEEARALHRQMPQARLVGEVDGYPIEGFHYGNSPSAIADLDLNGHHLIQRTTQGTRAAVAARSARELLVSSFVCAGATLAYLREQTALETYLVLSGRRSGRGGEDDEAVADYLAARTTAENVAAEPFIERLRQSPSAQKFLRDDDVFPRADLDAASQVDRFGFAQVASWVGGQLVLKPANPRRG